MMASKPYRPPAAGRRDSPRGFTLLEVMVAMAIATIVLGMLYTVLGDLRRAMVHADRRALPSRTAQDIFTVMTTDLESAFIPNRSKLAFYATDDDHVVRFLSTADSSPLPDGRQGDNIEVAYIPVETDDGLSVFRRESIFIDDKPLEGGQLTLLAKELKVFELLFYDGQTWRSKWNNLGSENVDPSERESGLPRAIRISLVTKDGERFTTAIEPIRSSLGVK